jgi:putative ABC transport system substrate-binding protein
MTRVLAMVMLVVVALAAPPAVEGQQPGKVYRLAVVFASAPVSERTKATLFSELRRLGHAEGMNLVVDRRSGEGRREIYPEVAREVVQRGPDVIFAASGRLAQAFRASTKTIPIVTVTSDPVALGLAASLARPDGNVTGIRIDAGNEIFGKRLELLKEAVPSASRCREFNLNPA